MVHESDVKFAMAKATEGETFVDAYLKAKYAGHTILATQGRVQRHRPNTSYPTLVRYRLIGYRSSLGQPSAIDPLPT